MILSSGYIGFVAWGMIYLNYQEYYVQDQGMARMFILLLKANSLEADCRKFRSWNPHWVVWYRCVRETNFEHS